jgi:hypothetical protein
LPSTACALVATRARALIWASVSAAFEGCSIALSFSCSRTMG